MDNWLARTRLLLGDEAVNSLRHSRVAVLGLGGVGGASGGSHLPQRRRSHAAGGL